MPRLDRFVDPIHQGIDYMKHRAEDVYDTTAQSKPSFWSNLFGRRSTSYSEPISRMASYSGGKMGQRIAETLTGKGRGYGHERHGGGLFSGRGHESGYHEDEGGIFRYLENNVLTSPLLFVAFPLVLGLFISAWAHKQIRVNRAWYDRITIPKMSPASWLYDPMWTVVLTAMGYSAWLVFEEGGFGNWLSLGVYNLGLFSLFAWPLVFFNLHDSVIPPILASISTLLIATANVLFFFYSASAGLLMLLPTLWISYMTIINWQVYSANKGTFHAGKEKGDWPWTATATSGVGGVAQSETREAKKVR